MRKLLCLSYEFEHHPPRTERSKVKRGKASPLDPMKGAMSRYTRLTYFGTWGVSHVRVLRTRVLYLEKCLRVVPIAQTFMLSHSSATGSSSIENVEKAVTSIARIRSTRFNYMKSIMPSLPSEYTQRNRIYLVHRKGNLPGKYSKASLGLYERSIHSY